MARCYPTIEQFRALAAEGHNLIPVYREVVADLETPVSAYLKVAADYEGPSFLLESVEGGERMARYSFIGAEPYRVLRTGEGEPDGSGDPLVAIEAELARFRPAQLAGLPRFVGGAVGYLSYETVHYFEPRVPVPARDPQGLPEAVFLFTDSLLVFDHVRRRIQVVATAHVDGSPDEAYRRAVERIDELAERLARPLPRQAQLAPEPVDVESAAHAAAGYREGSNKTPDEYHAMVRRAKECGITNVTAEVTPHHLTLTDEAILGRTAESNGKTEAYAPLTPAAYDTTAKVNPPLREQTDVDAMIQGLREGTIDFIATDHAPHNRTDKECTFHEAAFGISTLETALGQLMSLVHSGAIDLTLLIEKLTLAPTRFLRRNDLGTLRQGTPADITIIDPDAEWVVDTAQFASKGKNTPLQGATLRGRVHATLVAGKVTY